MPVTQNPDPLTLLRPISKIVTSSYTRPNDTVAYAAGDVLADSTTVATILTFAGVARSAGLGFLLDGVTMVHNGAPASKPDLELWLFDTAPTMQQDNAVWNPTDAELEKVIAIVSLPGAAQTIAAPLANNGNMALPSVVGSKIKQCAAGATSVFGIAVMRSAYTPLALEKFTFRLHVVQD